jgi:hypothetical protein
MFSRVGTVIRQRFTATQLRWIIAALVFVGVYTWAFCVIFPQWRRFERVTHAGAHTSGTIVAKEPQNHASIRYAYTVDDARYEGVMTAGWGGIPSLDRVQIGDVISVAYWPEQPSVSVPGDPHEIFASWCGLLFLVAPFMSLVAAFVTMFRSRRRIARFMEPAHT